MANPLEAYPILMKPQHIQEATQYCKTTTYELIREMENYQQSLPPGSEKLVHRRPGGRGIRINRDGFFLYFATKHSMTVPEELKGA